MTAACVAPSGPQEDAGDAASVPDGSDDLNFDNNNGATENNDSDENENATDGGPSTTPRQDAGPQQTEDPDPVEEESDGACDNAADEAELEALEDTLEDIIGNCALSCILASDRATCGGDCVSADTGLSNGCSGCFGEIIACTADHCAVPCGWDAEGEDCASCREENCNDDFEACAGIPAQ